jgi:hypothetical protein
MVMTMTIQILLIVYSVCIYTDTYIWIHNTINTINHYYGDIYYYYIVINFIIVINTY